MDGTSSMKTAPFNKTVLYHESKEKDIPGGGALFELDNEEQTAA